MNIAVIYSLPTRRAMATPYKATDEDTKDSAEEVAAALAAKGAIANLTPVTEDSINRIKKVSADVIFNIIEWDGFDTPLAIAAFDALEDTHIPYTGPGKEAVAVSNDKAKMKATLKRSGLPTPRWQIFENGTEEISPDFLFPAIVKLSLEHCSIGLTKDAVVSKKEDLIDVVTERINTFHQPVIAEEFIAGRELQVTVYEGKRGLAVLPPAEILFDTRGTNAFLTYNSRWEEGHADYKESHVAQATLSPFIAQKIDFLSRRTFRVFGFRDYCRLDIRLRDDDIFLLEANANPGLEDDDAYGMTVSISAAGMTFADFCWEIVASCLRRSTSLQRSGPRCAGSKPANHRKDFISVFAHA